mmetsp:Transcript_1939/g.4414  ORF Transcript_1939/g.4414 Transcript_1939/m.4414 type:complete len:280 (-) Transcript_1939:102-941(-)
MAFINTSLLGGSGHLGKVAKGGNGLVVCVAAFVKSSVGIHPDFPRIFRNKETISQCCGSISHHLLVPFVPGTCGVIVKIPGHSLVPAVLPARVCAAPINHPRSCHRETHCRPILPHFRQQKVVDMAFAQRLEGRFAADIFEQEIWVLFQELGRKKVASSTTRRCIRIQSMIDRLSFLVRIIPAGVDTHRIQPDNHAGRGVLCLDLLCSRNHGVFFPQKHGCIRPLPLLDCDQWELGDNVQLLVGERAVFRGVCLRTMKRHRERFPAMNWTFARGAIACC